MTELRP